jgi:hypothetical protein
MGEVVEFRPGRGVEQARPVAPAGDGIDLI